MGDNSELKRWSIDLAIEIIEYHKWLTMEKREYIMSKQILRSGTSVGANIHEAYFAISRADFINKMQIALKECSETEYWLLILEKTGYWDGRFDGLKGKNLSAKRMLIATLNTSKGNRQ